jgi:tRNA(fMet)-specific endonuclease VapC
LQNILYLLDTNIVILYLRSHLTAQEIDEKYNPLGAENTALLSVVSVGELRALGLMNKWGKARMKRLEALLSELLIMDINAEKVIELYAKIDAYSQNRLEGKPLNDTPRNMGKNDVWIAATAAVTQAKLITVDKDFAHLDGKYLEVICLRH